jgi:probable HAF family extracellular repeat protein
LGENGEVIGNSLAGAEQHVFVWSPARGMIDLGTGPSGFSAAWAVDINSRGDIVGYTAPCVLNSESRCTDYPIDYGFNPAFTGGDVRAILWRKR